MFAKRLAIILMLIAGASHYRICNILKVSSSTTLRLNQQLDDGDFDSIKKFVKNKKNTTYVKKHISFLAAITSPTLSSKDIWQYLDQEGML